MPDGPWPPDPGARDRVVLARRGARPVHDPWRYQGLIVEDERTPEGHPARAATVLLTGQECPWRCAMCDLWQYTTVTGTPPGAIPAQLRAARAALGSERIATIKLYNAGSFFDPRAVPDRDYDAAAEALGHVTRVVVESHPALIGPRVDRLLDALARHAAFPGPALEVAMGLETAHPLALERLNKRITIGSFSSAAGALARRGVALRVFLLIAPPFVPERDQDQWLGRSLEAALSFGASVVSLIPTRPGNGTLEALAAEGWFHAPALEDVERSLDLALDQAAGRARVFVDLWDLDRLSRCSECFDRRRARLHAMNLEQRVLPPQACPDCGHR